MDTFEQKTRKMVRVSLKRFIWTIVIVVVIAVAVLFSFRDMRYKFGSFDGARMIPQIDIGNNGISSDSLSIYPDYDYYNRGGQADITDTREFLKVSYGANIQTRDVQDTVKDVKNAVRDALGRLDNMNSSEKSGYVSFVVPKSGFDEFRDEVESITHRKLYTENISSQNFLTQKQGIEQRAESASTSLASVEKRKMDLDAEHSRAVSVFKRDLGSVNSQLAVTRQERVYTEDEVRMLALDTEENSLIQQRYSIIQQQSDEAKNYSYQNKNLISQIDQVKLALQDIGKQDEKFTNNVETVSGSVSVRWVSLWRMSEIFSPIHPTIIIIVLALAILFFLNRRGYIPKVEFV